MIPADIHITRETAKQVLVQQHGDLASLKLGDRHEGWDCVFFRLGDHHAMRFPRREQMVPFLEQELRWLSELGPFTGVAVPVAERVGVASPTFPWPWTIVGWIEGDAPLAADSLDPSRAAATLGEFYCELHVPAPVDAPANPFRGGRVSDRRERFSNQLKKWEQAAARLSNLASPDELLAWFDQVCAVPDWSGPPVWIHGDLHAANLVAHDGDISAVIDWVDVTSGDPAVDLTLVWNLFEAAERAQLRESLPYDLDTWRRAQAWALSFVLFYATGGPHIEPIAAPMWRRLVEDRELLRG